MLSVIGKVYGRVQRIREDAGVFCEEQCCFGRRRSCADQVFAETNVLNIFGKRKRRALGFYGLSKNISKNS